MPEPAPQWAETELAFELPSSTANPYTDVDVWVDFIHSDGEVLTRPAFWDGGNTWRCRFSSTQPGGTWDWLPHASVNESALSPQSGTLQAGPPLEENARGLLRLAPSGRTLAHSDGTPALIVADTAWAMPWRATVEDVEQYASNRQQKGFNAVLLMTVQPDMGATGPRGRNIDYGFEVGFEDLPNGHLNLLNVDYFRYFDQIVSALHRHGIIPILQPVFHGFGWKGMGVAGPVVPPEEYARYCRYLVARYGARPAIYLVGADGSGTEPQVEAGGVEVQRWDAYSQPTGIHYQPHSTADAHQAAEWLDFQSCQTGHQGDHVPDRVANLWRNVPHKAVMNGEPTYEQTVRPGNGAGWWQGHEAWSNLCAGGTMGVAYGAGSLWQWRVRADEPGFHPYFLAEGAGWQEALEFEGSRYVGLVGKILAGLPTSNLQPSWDLALCTRGLVDPGVLFIAYAEHGGRWDVRDTNGHVPSPYWVIDPKTGAVVTAGRFEPGGGEILDDSTDPRVLICCDTPPRIAASG